MNRRCSACFIVCLILFSYVWRASAAGSLFSFELESASVRQGDTVRLKLNASRNDLAVPVAGFRVSVFYDPDRVVFQRAETSDQVQSGAFQYYARDDQVVGVYVCDGVSAPRLQGNCITFLFSVREDADPGKTGISAEIDQIVDWTDKLHPEENMGQEVTLKINPPLSSEALLASLVPSQGVLEPPFSPDVPEYSLDVDADVSSVEFSASAEDDGSVKINRKTLQRAGLSTEILITVTSADKKSKTQYLVTVNRAEKEILPSSDPPPEERDGGEAEVKSVNSETGTKKVNSETGAKSASSGAGTKNAGAGTGAKNVGSGTGTKGAAKDAPGAAAEPAQTQQAAPVVYGDRNLYIVGSQTPSYLFWILIVCVCILTVVTALANFSGKNRNGG